MRNGEPQVYGAVVVVRTGYLQIQWARVQTLVLFDTVSFPLAFLNSKELLNLHLVNL